MCDDRVVPLFESPEPSVDSAALLDSVALFEPAVVHQATGMMAIRLGVSCTDALAYLRGYAVTAGMSLVAVAEGVVERSLFPGA
ncbi:hypothetical protein PP1_031445 [Pseudonocardia sp. P1]